MKNLTKLLVSIFTCLSVGLSGSLVTFPSLQDWYPTLIKPFFNPPSWIFGPVWTFLYLLMGVSAYLVWKKGLKDKNVRVALLLFLIQLLLNFLWSFFFFGLRLPLVALIEIAVLWFSILFVIINFWKVSKLAALILVPYLLWVGFATALNYFIVVLN